MLIQKDGKIIIGGSNKSIAEEFPAFTLARYISETVDVPKFDNEKTLILFPNPVQQILSFSNSTKGTQCKILDEIGRLVQQGKMEQQVDISKLSKGAYILQQIEGENGTLIRFIKE